MPAFIPPFATFFRAPTRTLPRQIPRFRTAFAGLTLLSAAAYLPIARADEPQCRSTSTSTTAMSLKDISTIKDISGNDLPPSTFENKVVFAMNVASACGYTKSGYDLLKRLTDKYPEEDFVAVAIPCNSFGWQESGSPDEIKTFALARAEKLVITERSTVNGEDAHPIVELGRTKFPGRVNWNFDARFVFDRNGVPVARFGNSAQPEEIEQAIDKVL